MAYQKLQAYRALEVITSDTVDIPNLAMLAVSSNTTSNLPGKLIDASQNFTTNGVKVGDIIYTGTVAGKVIAIDSANTLTVGIAVSSGAAYTIYGNSDAPNNGCVLYVGGAGDLKVTTAGGDEVTFKGLNAGTFIPVQVTRAWATPDGGGTAASDVIALW
jgi:hypothetical protein